MEVAAGRYRENIVITQPVTVYGAGGTVIVDGGHRGPVVNIVDTGERTVEIRNLVLTRGEATYDDCNYRGGGMCISNASVKISGCRIVDNEANDGGGIAAVSNSRVVLKDSEVVHNSADASGGGIYVMDSELEIARTRLVNNGAFYAGAMIALSSQFEITNTLFQANKVFGPDTSAALDILDSEGDVLNSVFIENHGATVADIYVSASASTVMNNIFGGGRGVALYGSWRDSVVMYNDVYGYVQQSGGDIDIDEELGNISVSPEFVAYSKNRNPYDDDFHLQPSSPCRDAGNSDADWADPDGSRNDMGMYGGPDAMP